MALDIRAELGVGVAVVVLITASAELRDAVLGAPAVDGILGIPAVVARHALVLVARLRGAELGSSVAVLVGVAVGPERRDAVQRAVLIHRELVLAAKLAGEAAIGVGLGHSTVHAVDFHLVARAELGFGVAVMVAVAVGTDGRNASGGAVLIDGEARILAVLAWDAGVAIESAGECSDFVDLVSRAELRLGVAVMVAVTAGAGRGHAVLGALLVDRVGVLLAPVAGSALVFVALDGRTKLSLCVAVVVSVAVRLKGRDAVPRALVIQGILALLAVLARAAVALRGAELGLRVAMGVPVAVGANFRLAVLRALLVDRVGVLLAELAANAYFLLGRAELSSGVTMGMRGACSASLRRAVHGALLVD
jgi:hypothetical protein